MSTPLPDDEHLSITERSYRAFDRDEAERPHAELPDSLDPILALVRPVEQQGADAA